MTRHRFSWTYTLGFLILMAFAKAIPNYAVTVTLANNAYVGTLTPTVTGKSASGFSVIIQQFNKGNADYGFDFTVLSN